MARFVDPHRERRPTVRLSLELTFSGEPPGGAGDVARTVAMLVQENTSAEAVKVEVVE